MVGDAYRAGVEIIPVVRPYGADDDTVYLQHMLTGEPVILDGVSALVLSQGHQSCDGLLHELEGYDAEVHGIGDCLAPRTVEEAVLEGLKVGHVL